MLRVRAYRRARHRPLPRAERALTFDVVIPTAGRRSLAPLLARLADVGVPAERIRVVEDAERRGPALARNAGWRASRAEWVTFLDDDVLPEPDWLERLHEDLAAPADDVAA